MTNCTVHLVLKSSNTKTGKIPVSMTSSDSCPLSCPLLNSGCYAQQGPLGIHRRQLDNGVRGIDWETFCGRIADLPEGQLWRHNQSGDLPHADQEIDKAAMENLVVANAGKRGFTYTHHDMTRGDNAAVVKACNASGFTVNLSADSLDEADTLADLEVGPVVTILPEKADGPTTTPAGRRVIVCPAVTRDDVTCASCKLCARPDRAVVIGFPLHGSMRRTAARKLGAIS